MRTPRKNILGMMTLVLILAVGSAQKASAGIRVKASVRTPHVGVRVDTGPGSHYHQRLHRRLPTGSCKYHEVKKRDWKIARRLGWYTGESKRELIALKREGYSWKEIGRWYEVPRPVVRAAMNSRSWDRFLRRQDRLARCGTRPDPQRRVISYHCCEHGR